MTSQTYTIEEIKAVVREIEERFNTNVDVLTTDSLSDKFLQRISGEEILLYEQ